MNNNIDELKALIVLNSIPTLGPVRIKRLVEHFGCATKVLDANIEELSQVENIGENIAKTIVKYKDKINVDKEIELLKNNEIQIISYKDENYPEVLRYLSDPPVILYVKGEIKKSDMISVAVVGTRKPTSYGRMVTEQLIKELAEYNLTIVSGLAYGIDTVAHQSAIKYGLRTIAVLGNGLGIYYPLINKKLQQQIPRYGAVVSEFPYFYKPNKTTFPQRNRIIAALSLGTVVVEADLQSGAMITAKFAAELGKDVFAVPGSIFSRQSRGTNYLIKSGAKIVTSAEDIIEEIKSISEFVQQKILSKKSVVTKQEIHASEITGKARIVLDVIMSEPEGIHIDKLQAVTNIEISELMKILFELQVMSKIKELPGKFYVSI